MLKSIIKAYKKRKERIADNKAYNIELTKKILSRDGLYATVEEHHRRTYISLTGLRVERYGFFHSKGVYHCPEFKLLYFASSCYDKPGPIWYEIWDSSKKEFVEISEEDVIQRLNVSWKDIEFENLNSEIIE